MGSSIVVVIQVFVNVLLEPRNVSYLVFGVTDILFAQDSVKSFNEGLFIFLVGLGGSDAINVFSGILLPFSFEFRSSVALDMLNRFEKLQMGLKGFSACLGIECQF